jgi:hypothetical protein
VGGMYPAPRDLAGFFLWFVRERSREAIGMAMTVGVVTSVGNQVQGWHCRGRPETGGGRHQVLGGVGGKGLPAGLAAAASEGPR